MTCRPGFPLSRKERRETPSRRPRSAPAAPAPWPHRGRAGADRARDWPSTAERRPAGGAGSASSAVWAMRSPSISRSVTLRRSARHSRAVIGGTPDLRRRRTARSGCTTSRCQPSTAAMARRRRGLVELAMGPPMPAAIEQQIDVEPEPVLERDAGLGDAGLAIDLQGEAPEIHGSVTRTPTAPSDAGPADADCSTYSASWTWWRSLGVRPQSRKQSGKQGLDERRGAGHV